MKTFLSIIRKDKLISKITGLSSLLILFGVFFYLLAFRSTPNEETVAPNTESEISPPDTICGVIKKNSSLYASMLSAGIPADCINKITETLQGAFDLRHSRPGDRFEFAYFPPDTIVNFEYKTFGRDKYLILPKEDSLVVIKIRKNLKRFLKGIRGKVKNSLWETLVEMGEKPTLIGKLADIFAWDIDFLTDVRDGDEFDFIVEGFEEDGKTVFYGDILIANYILSGVNHYAVLYKNSNGISGYYNLRGEALQKTLLKSPLNYRRITSKFSRSRMHPILKIRRPHYGVDFAAPTGTPVVAAGDGEVAFKGWRGEYGNSVIISHANGYQTYYGHLSRFAKGISKGKKVKQNQVIGYVGMTGLATGPHLDYRVKKDGRFIDPLNMKLPSASPVPKNCYDDFCSVRDEMLLTLETIGDTSKVYVSKASTDSFPKIAYKNYRSNTP